ncbi:hypothetical protein DRP05_02780 [Archaeoglobales archaeon]|nr:MAG: hypothetical protein DRP05_02780 [Archaeoglobales archaeon]
MDEKILKEISKQRLEVISTRLERKINTYLAISITLIASAILLTVDVLSLAISSYYQINAIMVKIVVIFIISLISIFFYSRTAKLRDTIFVSEKGYIIRIISGPRKVGNIEVFDVLIRDPSTGIWHDAIFKKDHLFPK